MGLAGPRKGCAGRGGTQAGATTLMRVCGGGEPGSLWRVRSAAEAWVKPCGRPFSPNTNVKAHLIHRRVYEPQARSAWSLLMTSTRHCRSTHVSRPCLAFTEVLDDTIQSADEVPDSRQNMSPVVCRSHYQKVVQNKPISMC
jgi:hypothetical protein